MAGIDMNFINTVVGEQPKPAEVKSGEVAFENKRQSLFNVGSNAGGAFITSDITGNYESFLSETTKYVVEGIKRRLESYNSGVRDQLDGCEYSVVYLNTTPDASGNFISNPTIVVAFNIPNNKVSDGVNRVLYVPFTFAHLGKSTDTVESIIAKYGDPTVNKFGKFKPDLFANTVDDIYFDIIKDKLRNKINGLTNSTKFVCLDPKIFSDLLSNQEDIPALAGRIVDIATTAISTEYLVTLKNVFQDTRISDIVGNDSTEPKSLKINIEYRGAYDPNVSVQNIRNQMGSPNRADFHTTLYSASMGMAPNSNSRNKTAANINILGVSGYVDMIPAVVPNVNGGSILKFIPNVIATETSTRFPTIQNKLLSLVTLYLMVGRNYILYPIMANRNTSTKDTEITSSVGNLNILANALGEDNPKALNFASGKMTEESIVNYIKDIVMLDRPLISMDITNYTADSYIESVFLYAAAGGKYADVARKQIVKAAHELTNGQFPLDFDTNKIFANTIDIPSGYFVDNHGIARDIRCIDFSMLTKYSSGDTSLLIQWNEAMTGRDNGSAFYNIIKMLYDVNIRNAVITGTTTRIMFNGEFITNLYTACLRAGFQPFMDLPGVNVGDKVTFGGMDVLSGAIVDNNNISYFNMNPNPSGFTYGNPWVQQGLRNSRMY